MDEKNVFQETAQKLIDYDSRNKWKYQCDQDVVDYAAKRIYAHRIVLAGYLILIVYQFLKGTRVGIFDNILFLTLFIIFYIRYIKKF